MKKGFKLLFATLVMGVVGVVGAQNLDTTAVTDQFTSGLRGNTTGSGTFGASSNTGSESAVYIGADATPGAGITYINAYAGGSGATDSTNGESPVQAVGTIIQPDRGNAFSALTQPITITANTQPGATSGSNVVTVSDDGGQNCLILGDTGSANYFAQVDFYAIDRSANPTEYEACYLAIRSCSNGASTDFGYSIDRDPGYALWYDYNLKQVLAVSYKAGTTQANITGRGGAGVAYTAQFGTTQTGITTGWHTFRIEANGSTITFKLDGATIFTGTDATIASGRVALGYRSNVAGANESAGVFDNLVTGPMGSATGDWEMYN